MSTTRRQFLVMLGATGALAACGGGGGGDGSGGDGAAAAEDAGEGAETSAATPTVLALGEEYLLADLLALGITPVASTTNVQTTDRFAGLDEFDTSGIEPLPVTEPNL